MDGAAARIEAEAASWEGVTVAPHRFGGIEFRLGRRELGHLHGDRPADLPLTVARRDELIAAGRVQRHRWLPDSGWASRPIRDEPDVQDVLALLREQYDRAAAKAAARA